MTEFEDFDTNGKSYYLELTLIQSTKGINGDFAAWVKAFCCYSDGFSKRLNAS